MPNGYFTPLTNVSRSCALPVFFGSRRISILPAPDSATKRSPFGATNIHRALELAFGASRTKVEDPATGTGVEQILAGADTVVLLTDGDPTTDSYDLREELYASNENILTWLRYGITIGALIIALFILHAWLPAGRRNFLQILPGIVFTMVASLISGIAFGQYLARFADRYVTMYAGLASVIIALVFLYFIAAIFVFGGELNAAIIKSRLPRGVSLQAAQSLRPSETQA